MKWASDRNQALEYAREYTQRGIAVSLSHLPVRPRNRADIDADVDEYCGCIDMIATQGIDGDVTIKPLQFGAADSPELADESMSRVLAHGRERGVRVWIDQDLCAHVDTALSVARSQDPADIGVCLQAYRERTRGDVAMVAGYPLRLVKGFYNDYDVRPWSRVGTRYHELMDVVIEESPYPCFATHDVRLIERAKELLKGREGELQFFRGVRDDYAERLVSEGYRVRVYIPYGRVFRFLWRGMPEFDLPRALQRLMHRSEIR